MNNRLRDLRQDADLNQTEVAKFLGMSQTGYSKYETGEIQMMDQGTINSLSDGAAPYLYDLYKTTHDDKIKSII